LLKSTLIIKKLIKFPFQQIKRKKFNNRQFRKLLKKLIQNY
jgi:hypothetical protein